MAFIQNGQIFAGLTAIFIVASAQAESAERKTVKASDLQKCLPADKVGNLVGKIIKANDKPDNADFDYLYAMKGISRTDMLRVTAQTVEVTVDGKTRTELQFVSAAGQESYGFARRFVMCTQDNKPVELKTALGDGPAP